MRLLIGTPAYGSVVTTGYVRSVLALVAKLVAARVPVDHSTRDNALVNVARNQLASKALAGDFTHLLFVDADVEFPPDLFDRMLAFDRPLVAGVYRRKQEAKSFPAQLSQPIGRDGEFFRAEAAPAGLMLIRRDVLERLRNSASGDLNCFDLVYGADGVQAGEDVSFCRRWTGLGGEIWVTFDERIGHTGPYTFRGVPEGFSPSAEPSATDKAG